MAVFGSDSGVGVGVPLDSVVRSDEVQLEATVAVVDLGQMLIYLGARLVEIANKVRPHSGSSPSSSSLLITRSKSS